MSAKDRDQVRITGLQMLVAACLLVLALGLTTSGAQAAWPARPAPGMRDSGVVAPGHPAGERPALAPADCGLAWRPVGSPNPSGGSGILAGVAAVSPKDVWAVGYFIQASTFRFLTLIEHWDGQVWTVVPGRNPASSTNILVAVSAVSANDVWAVGLSSATGNGQNTP